MTSTRPPQKSDAPTQRRAPIAPDAESYCSVRGHTEALAARLGPEDQVVQSMPDASPTKWHRAHTTWFFEEFVLAEPVPHEVFDESFRYLFNSYYEAVGERQPRPQRGMITRPDVARVTEFRNHVDLSVLRALREGHLDARRLELVELGLHHEQQHQELLLMDALHLLSLNPTAPAYDDRDHGRPDGQSAPVATVAPPAAARQPGAPVGLLEFEGGLVEIGHLGAGFAYDNELPRHQVWLEPFALEDRLVTCGEWCEFIEDGGYQRPELWLSDGWHTVQSLRWDSPAYWSPLEDPAVSGARWQRYSLGGAAEVVPEEPVAHVSHYEADAFARWKGARLPSEAEWELAAVLHGQPRSAMAPDAAQFHGVLWQWTASAYLPYPGFSPEAGAVGEYNGKFMVNQQVLRGSSFATPAGHARSTYRNFFPAGSRWPFTGVRIAHDRH